ncbi:MAG: hypothetical protein K2P63_14675 [Lachnospiraceae bacterium]|nr:hypothetical protein [Lachnospiraceae bacterium]
MMKWKGTAAALMAAAVLSSTLNVSAAGLRDVFDAEYYAETYPELKASIGDDAEALFQHYVTYGLSQGMAGSKAFNVVEYRNAYADLDAVFGDNWDAYVDHYFTFGIAEGRTAGVYGETAPDSTEAEATQIWLEKGARLASDFNIGDAWGQVAFYNYTDDFSGDRYIYGAIEFRFDSIPYCDMESPEYRDWYDTIYDPISDLVYQKADTGYFISIDAGFCEDLERCYYEEDDICGNAGDWRGWQCDLVYEGKRYPTIIEYRWDITNVPWWGSHQAEPDYVYAPGRYPVSGAYGIIERGLEIYTDAPKEVKEHIHMGLKAFGQSVYLR